MKTIILSCLILISIQSCSENKYNYSKESQISFNDQAELKIEDKFFSVKLDSFNVYGLPNYRVDVEGRHQLIRYWVRNYNNMIEIRFYNREAFEIENYSDSIKVLFGYNYLIGIRTGKAFYIRWRNEPENPNKKFQFAITSDIGKYTVQLQTNLPRKIISLYYPDIKCPIELKEMGSIKIKTLDLGNIISSNYQPFY